MAHRAEALEATVAWGRCFDDLGAPPFWPWAQVIRTVADNRPAEELADLLGEGADDIAQIVPELKPADSRSGAAIGTRPAEIARFRLFEAIAGFLVRASGQRPLVVIIDDLHWADVASLEFLRYLGTNLAKASVVVAATYRTTDASTPPILTRTLADLLRRPALDTIALSGLTSDAVGQMLVEGLGAAPGREVVQAVHGRADGNPYFVVEIMRLLERRGAPPDLPDVLPGEVPDPVRHVVRNRLARLPDGVRALLHLAAVVGRDVELDLLTAAGGLSPADALGFVEAALESGFLKDSSEAVGNYRFSHALVQEALYNELHGLRRVRMHLQVAEALERLHGASGNRVIAIAHHFNEAVAVDGPDRAFAYAVRAAEVAWSALAYEDAITHLRCALELLARTPPGPERVGRELGIQLRLAGWTSMAKGWTAAAMGDVWQRATELCRDTDQTPQLLASLWGLFVWSVMSGEIRTTRQMVDQMTDLGRASEDATALMLGEFATGYLKLHLGQIPAAFEPLHRAVTLSQDLDDRALIETLTVHPAVVSLSGLTVASSLAGDREQAERWRKETLVAIDRVDHPFSHVVGLVLIGAADSLWRDVDRVLAGTEEAGALATELGYHHYELQARVLHGSAIAQRDDPFAGMAMMEHALSAIENDGTQSLRPFLLALLAGVRRQCGRPKDALAAVDEAVRIAELTHERFSLAELYRLRGELILEIGPDRRDEGATWLRRAVELAESQGAGLLARRAAASLAS